MILKTPNALGGKLVKEGIDLFNYAVIADKDAATFYRKFLIEKQEQNLDIDDSLLFDLAYVGGGINMATNWLFGFKSQSFSDPLKRILADENSDDLLQKLCKLIPGLTIGGVYEFIKSVGGDEMKNTLNQQFESNVIDVVDE